MTPHKKFEGEIYALNKEEGGRHTPFFTNYKPQFFFRTADVTGGASCVFALKCYSLTRCFLCWLLFNALQRRFLRHTCVPPWHSTTPVLLSHGLLLLASMLLPPRPVDPMQIDSCMQHIGLCRGMAKALYVTHT